MTAAEVTARINRLYIRYMEDRDFEKMMIKAQFLITKANVPPHEVWQIGSAVAAFYEGHPVRMH